MFLNIMFQFGVYFGILFKENPWPFPGPGLIFLFYTPAKLPFIHHADRDAQVNQITLAVKYPLACIRSKLGLLKRRATL